MSNAVMSDAVMSDAVMSDAVMSNAVMRSHCMHMVGVCKCLMHACTRCKTFKKDTRTERCQQMQMDVQCICI
jgi:hypothetical protein